MSELESTEKTVKTKENTSQAERIAQLEGQVNQLMALLQAQMAQKPTNVVPPTLQTVKIIHLVERAPGLKTLIKLSNLTIMLRNFGEERNLTLTQFEELVGKYRKWFIRGIIGVHGSSEEIAKLYGLETASKYPIDGEFILQLGNKSMEQIESVFPRLPEAGKDSILSYWARKARAGDKKFADIRKLEVLNRLSDGAFTQLIAEINEKNNKNK